LTAKQYKAARLKLGLSHSQLAKRIGRHKSIISKRERGLKPITTEAEQTILRLLEKQEAGK